MSWTRGPPRRSTASLVEVRAAHVVPALPVRAQQLALALEKERSTVGAGTRRLRIGVSSLRSLVSGWKLGLAHRLDCALRGAGRQASTSRGRVWAWRRRSSGPAQPAFAESRWVSCRESVAPGPALHSDSHGLRRETSIRSPPADRQPGVPETERPGELTSFDLHEPRGFYRAAVHQPISLAGKAAGGATGNDKICRSEGMRSPKFDARYLTAFRKPAKSRATGPRRALVRLLIEKEVKKSAGTGVPA